MFGIHASFQAELFAALAILNGYVVFPGPVDAQARFCQCLHNLCPVANSAFFNARQNVVVYGLLGCGARVSVRAIFGYGSPTYQPGAVQVGMFRGIGPDAGRVVRSGPAFPVVVLVAEYIKLLLPAGRAWVKRFAAGKFHTRNDKMQFMVPGMGMANPQNIALIGCQPSKRHFFKVVHYLFFLLWRDGVFRVPGKHPRREPP